ncbi:MAG TPA: hypothetical protein VHC20_03970 [Candidatus Paceibacterota bacterium]|nr:hypothetical protein [Candidatus Paceibacterota bacterium]
MVELSRLQSNRAAVTKQCGLLIVLLCAALSRSADAQTANISGIINRYTPVVLIDKCDASVVVRNSFDFAAGV